MIRHLVRRLCRLTYRDIFERSYGSPTDVDEVWRHREMLQDARRPKRHIPNRMEAMAQVVRQRPHGPCRWVKMFNGREIGS